MIFLDHPIRLLHRLLRSLVSGPKPAWVLFVAATCAAGQTLTTAPDEVPQQIGNGFHLYDVSVSTGYSQLTGPAGTTLPSGGQFFGGVATWFSASAGYTHNDPNNAFNITYSATDTELYRYTDNWLDQQASLSWSRRLGSKARFHFSGSGRESTAANFVFLFPVSASPASNLAPDQGMFTPALAAATQGLLFGTRVLDIETSTGVSYNPTTRAHFNADVGAFQLESRPNVQDPGVAVIPRARALNGSASFGYNITPRLEIGVQGTVLESWSIVGRYRDATGGVYVAKQLGRRWLLSTTGALATVSPIGPSTPASTITYAASGKLAYRGREHSVVFSYARIAGDQYGFGSNATTEYLTYWNWRQRGRSWGLQVGGDRQQLEGGFSRGCDIWAASMGVSRALGSRASMSFLTSYLRETFATGLPAGTASALAGRMTLSWTPRLRDVSPLISGDSEVK
jgi:hypothetical protein